MVHSHLSATSSAVSALLGPKYFLSSGFRALYAVSLPEGSPVVLSASEVIDTMGAMMSGLPETSGAPARIYSRSSGYSSLALSRLFTRTRALRTSSREPTSSR